MSASEGHWVVVKMVERARDIAESRFVFGSTVSMIDGIKKRSGELGALRSTTVLCKRASKRVSEWVSE